MYRLRHTFKILMVFVFLGCMLDGCSIMQADQQATLNPGAPDETMEGPGLFTGEDGEATIFKR